MEKAKGHIMGGRNTRTAVVEGKEEIKWLRAVGTLDRVRMLREAGSPLAEYVPWEGLKETPYVRPVRNQALIKLF